MAETLLLLQWCKNYSTGILCKAWLEVFLNINEFYPTFNLPGPQLCFWLKDSTNYVHSTIKFCFFSSYLRIRSTKSLKYKMLPFSYLYQIQLCISLKNWDRFFFGGVLGFFFLTVQAQRTPKPCTWPLPRLIFLVFYLFIPFWLQK